MEWVQKCSDADLGFWSESLGMSWPSQKSEWPIAEMEFWVVLNGVLGGFEWFFEYMSCIGIYVLSICFMTLHTFTCFHHHGMMIPPQLVHQEMHNDGPCFHSYPPVSKHWQTWRRLGLIPAQCLADFPSETYSSGNCPWRPCLITRGPCIPVIYIPCQEPSFSVVQSPLLLVKSPYPLVN